MGVEKTFPLNIASTSIKTQRASVDLIPLLLPYIFLFYQTLS